MISAIKGYDSSPTSFKAKPIKGKTILNNIPKGLTTGKNNESLPIRFDDDGTERTITGGTLGVLSGILEILISVA